MKLPKEGLGDTNWNEYCSLQSSERRLKEQMHKPLLLMPPPPPTLLLPATHSFHCLTGNGGGLPGGGCNACACRNTRFHVSTNVCKVLLRDVAIFRRRGFGFCWRLVVSTCIHFRRLLPVACAQFWSRRQTTRCTCEAGDGDEVEKERRRMRRGGRIVGSSSM